MAQSIKLHNVLCNAVQSFSWMSVQLVKSIHQYFRFFGKKVINITISALRPFSNESPGNFTFYSGIHEFLKNHSIFDAVVFISQKIL